MVGHPSRNGSQTAVGVPYSLWPSGRAGRVEVPPHWVGLVRPRGDGRWRQKACTALRERAFELEYPRATAAVRRHGPDHHRVVHATLRRADEHHADLCFLGDVADLTFAVDRDDRDLHHGQP